MAGAPPLPPQDVQAQLGVHVDRYLGGGAFRSVYAAVIMATGEEVAVACEALSDEQQTESAVTQRITSVPSHPHVLGPPSSPNITLHLEADGNMYTVLERMERELFDVLEGGALIEEDARDYFVQAVSGVRFMHQNGVGHRDIKLENMMLTPDGRLKLIDFGLAHIAPVPHTPDTPWSMMNSKTVGTRSYVAPEVGGPFAYDVRLYDVWSLGCTLFALSAGFFIVDRAVPTDPRFQRMQQAQAAGESTVRAIFGLYNRPCYLSDSLVRLLDGMFAIDPARRFTTDDVIASEWMVEQYAPHLALEQSYHTTWLAQPALPQGAVYRSLSGMSDDERPVWRSAGGAAASAVLGGASDGISREALPLEPPPVSRQRAQLNIAH